MTSADLVLSVSDFVAVFNQTIDYAYPQVTIVGELSNFRVSKNRWVYFDLKDEMASVKFFGTVYQLPGPLEDGLMVQVSGAPRLHPLYGFSVTIQSIQPVGEGSLKRAAALLEAKLRAEGLFDESRKRPLPYPPKRIGLIASGESAAYHDFTKILNSRWGGVAIEHADVQVQGEAASRHVQAALDYFNLHDDPVDVIVITRGGGSAEDLAAFSTEQVTRAIAASRIPTLVAIGHEIDISLGELAADQRASTPSNAAELLVPDKQAVLMDLSRMQETLYNLTRLSYERKVEKQQAYPQMLTAAMQTLVERHWHELKRQRQLLGALDPLVALKRGYAVVSRNGKALRSVKDFRSGDTIDLRLQDGNVKAQVQ